MLTPCPGRLAARVLLPALLPFCVFATTPDTAPPPEEAPVEVEAPQPETDAPAFAAATPADDSSPIEAIPAEPVDGTTTAMKRPPTPTLLTVPPFSNYEIILLRKPFGNPPPVPEKAAPVDNSALVQAQEEQKLAKQIHMVAVNKTPSGRTAVGFIDKSEKPERNYYINVGDTVNGYTVVEASYEDETATLTKEGVTITLKLGQGLIKGGGAGADTLAGRRAVTEAAVPAESATASPPLPLPAGAPTMPPPSSALRTLNSESFRERLSRQRAEREAADTARQQRAALDAEERAERITKEQLEKGTREINLNLIRQGMNPLSPITLTPEEDAEMVKLGVLQ